MITKDILWIIWGARWDVDGLIFYGSWSDGFPINIQSSICRFEEIWISYSINFEYLMLPPNDTCDFLVRIKINEWPQTDWLKNIEASLKWFIDLDAKVSWCGSELSSLSLGSFSSDPSANTYAAYSKKTGFLCNSDLFEEYQDLTIDQLVPFREIISTYKEIDFD